MYNLWLFYSMSFINELSFMRNSKIFIKFLQADEQIYGRQACLRIAMFTK